VSPTYPTLKLRSHKCILDIAAPIDQLELENQWAHSNTKILGTQLSAWQIVSSGEKMIVPCKNDI